MDMKKIALVTGATSGIGLDTALRLINEGYTVYGASRRTELMKPIEENGGFSLSLDLCSEVSISACVNTILQKEGKIDLLVNNAGFGLGGGIEDVPIEDARKQFEVNVFGLSRLIQLVLPSMREHHSGKIINISSMAGCFSTPFSGWYHASKFSIEALSDALRMETAPFGIKVVIIEPGMIQTDWGVIHGKNIRKYSGNGAYKHNADQVAEYYETGYVNKRNLTKPEVISRLIVKVALKKNPKDRYAAGKYSKMFIFFRKILKNKMYDLVVRGNMKIK